MSFDIDRSLTLGKKKTSGVTSWSRRNSVAKGMETPISGGHSHGLRSSRNPVKCSNFSSISQLLFKWNMIDEFYQKMKKLSWYFIYRVYNGRHTIVFFFLFFSNFCSCKEFLARPMLHYATNVCSFAVRESDEDAMEKSTRNVKDDRRALVRALQMGL